MKTRRNDSFYCHLSKVFLLFMTCLLQRASATAHCRSGARPARCPGEAAEAGLRHLWPKLTPPAWVWHIVFRW